MRGRVLVIGGSDSGGGAGIQADVKTITALAGYATTAVTALTAQSTLGIFGVVAVPAEFIDLQIQVVLDDIGTDAIKTGMLHTREAVSVVAARLRSLGRPPPIVVDPVFVAGQGGSLLDAEGRNALVRKLLPLATLVTPTARACA